MGAVIYGLRDYFNTSVPRFVLGILFGGSVYGLSIYLLMPTRLIAEVKKVNLLRKK